jgi:hypothetical protein
VTPPSVQVGVNTTAVTVSVQTLSGSSALAVRDPSPRMSVRRFANFALIFAAFFAFADSRSRRRLLTFSSIFALLALMTACGGSSSGGSLQGGQGTPSTTPGTYYITVNAISGTAQTSYLLTLTVK